MRTVGFNGGRRLPVNVQADDEAYMITAEVPGLTADDLLVEVLEDLVTVRGKYEEYDHDNRLLSEIHRSGGFFRRIRLPETIDAEAVEAKVENGLLSVRLPKSEATRPKQIEVSSK
jgi:HSP20 family protein